MNNQKYIFKPEDSLNISTVVLKELYPKFSDTLVPFKTTGNGNCIWNMVSISLIGNESLQKILRLLTILALLMMQKEFVQLITNHYVSTKTDNAEDYAKINLQEYLRIALDDGAWGNLYHLIALSTVLGRNIYVYSFFKALGQFRLNKNVGIKQLDKEFSIKKSKIGHHLRYQPLYNQIFAKSNDNVIYGFFDGAHYTALIPKKQLQLTLFKPVNYVNNEVKYYSFIFYLKLIYFQLLLRLSDLELIFTLILPNSFIYFKFFLI